MSGENNSYTQAVFNQLTSNPNDRLPMMLDLAITGAPRDKALAQDCLGIRLDKLFPSGGTRHSVKAVDHLKQLCDHLKQCVDQRIKNYEESFQQYINGNRNPLPEEEQKSIKLSETYMTEEGKKATTCLKPSQKN